MGSVIPMTAMAVPFYCKAHAKHAESSSKGLEFTVISLLYVMHLWAGCLHLACHVMRGLFGQL